MSTPLQLQRNRNQRINVAKSTDIRKNDAQVEIPRSIENAAAIRVMQGAVLRRIPTDFYDL
jgi:hypothetical protein